MKRTLEQIAEIVERCINKIHIATFGEYRENHIPPLNDKLIENAKIIGLEEGIDYNHLLRVLGHCKEKIEKSTFSEIGNI
jgi:hypothetical protein